MVLSFDLVSGMAYAWDVLKGCRRVDLLRILRVRAKRPIINKIMQLEEITWSANKQ